MNLTPAPGKYILKMDPEEEKTAGGIVIPGSAVKEGNFATVVGHNPVSFRDKSGHLTPPGYEIGERVVLGQYAGVRIEHDGEEFVVVNQDEILATAGLVPVG